uniref:Putative secreted protein n=1 Tax=Anopheles triannulatus TaxID=58253 RepID=A0A2M4B136_9DIPT
MFFFSLAIRQVISKYISGLIVSMTHFHFRLLRFNLLSRERLGLAKIQNVTISCSLLARLLSAIISAILRYGSNGLHTVFFFRIKQLN